MPEFIVNTGRIRIRTYATNAATARRMVADVEGCPESCCIVEPIAPARPWRLERYGREWALFDTVSRCFVLFGSKRRMSERLRELNAGT